MFLLLLLSVFSGEEYKSAKVDPIAQFSKPVAVWDLIFCDQIFFFLSNLSHLYSLIKTLFFQSHMNRDHAEDTKVIVQHCTSVPVI